ncbi:sensor histidine kinase [uncultured Clostridium sp.]|uniref:sensor histidine kinase n=1 Tax=uncultured Clostridium sp. TaxID=59620 RepID=UPI002616F155|nr:sensor histidine kinase [uncultured Clostridium sp.]
MDTKSKVKSVSEDIRAFSFKNRGKICGVLILISLILMGRGIYKQHSWFKMGISNSMEQEYFGQFEVYEKLDKSSRDIASDVLITAYKADPNGYFSNLNKNKIDKIKEIKKNLSWSEVLLIEELEGMYVELLSSEENIIYSKKIDSSRDREIAEDTIKEANELLKEILGDDKDRLDTINNLNESFKKRHTAEKKIYDKEIKDTEEIFEIAMNIAEKNGEVAKKTNVGMHLGKNVDAGENLVFTDDIYTRNNGIYTGSLFFNNFADKKAPFIVYGSPVNQTISSGVYFKDVTKALEMVGYDMKSNKYSLSLSIQSEYLKSGEFEQLYKNHVAHTKNQYSYYENILKIFIICAILAVIMGLLLYKTWIFKWYRKVPFLFLIAVPSGVYLISLGNIYDGSHLVLLIGVACFISDLRYIGKFGLRARFETESKILNNPIVKKVTNNIRDIFVSKVQGIDKNSFKKIRFRRCKRFYAKYDMLINWILFGMSLCIIIVVFIGVGWHGSFLIDMGAIVCSITTSIGLIFILLKNQRLKKEIVEIEIATKKIVEGDFDIKFIDGKISSLNNIRENLVGIDKGFKIAIEDELKSERMKAELITNVSHDLKTPLTSIINYVDLLQKEGLDDGEKKAYIKILDHKSKRLKVLIEDLFEASKAATGNIQLNIETIDINSVLRQTFAEFKEKIDESELDFKISMPENKVFLNLDGARTWRIFENLIGNALKYSMDRTRVYIDLVEYEDKVVFEIKNISGYELNCNPSELKERFKRADDSRNTEGSGLGLAIANSLVEIQGGRLDIAIDGDLFKVRIIFGK